jgi:WD40 repeat protein/HEAT repeat protein
MPLTVACSCGQRYAVADEFAGRQVDCPLCGRVLTVDGPVPAPTAMTDDVLVVSCACGQDYSTPREFAGQQVNCPACGRMLFISDSAVAIHVGSQLPPSELLPPLPPLPGKRIFLLPVLLSLLVAGGIVAALLFLAVKYRDNDTTEPVVEKPEARADLYSPPPAREKAPPPVAPTVAPKKETPPSPPPAPRLPPPIAPGLSDVPWRGHVACIYQMSFAADGKSVLTASGGTVEKAGKEIIVPDNTLRRWDGTTGKELKRWTMTDKGISVAAFSPDGALMAIAGAAAAAKREIFVWDLRKKKQLNTLVAHGGPVRCLAFSPDGTQMLSGADDNLLLLWDVAKGRVVQELKGHTNAPNQVVFSPNGKQGLSCGMDHSARLWDLEGGRQLRQFTGHADIVWAIAFSSDGRFALTGGGMHQIPGIGLVAGGRDYEIRLWDTSTGKEQKRFPGHTSAVTALVFEREGRRFLSGSHDGSIRLWQIESGKELRRYDGHDGRVRAVSFFPTGRRALSAGDDGRLRTWALPLEVADLIADLRGADAEARLRALADLARRREEARAAIPALFQALIRPDEKLRAKVLELMRDLLPLGKEHVPRLDRLLADRAYPEGRLFALDALAALGADAAAAAKGLLSAVADKDPVVRRKAMKALVPVAGELGKDGFRRLLKALSDPDKEVRAGALSALAKLGTPSAEHVPALRGLLKDESEALRRFALKALADMGEAARPAVADIGARARAESSAELRVLVLIALANIAPRERACIEAFTRALADRDVSVCRQAAKGLAAGGAVQGLLQALRHADAEVAKIAGEALDRVKYEKEHAPLLVALLESKDESARLRGINALGKLAGDGAEGVSAMSKLLRNAGPEERSRLLAAFQQMGPGASKAGPALVPLLKNKDLAVRFEVCKTLKLIDAKEVSKAVLVLIDALRPAKIDNLEEEDDDKDREKARELLVSIGKPALKGLLDALESEFAVGGARTQAGKLNAVARLEVIKVLTAMGADARRNDVLVALAKVERNDPFSGVRKAAREARVKVQRKE